MKHREKRAAMNAKPEQMGLQAVIADIKNNAAIGGAAIKAVDLRAVRQGFFVKAEAGKTGKPGRLQHNPRAKGPWFDVFFEQGDFVAVLRQEQGRRKA